MKALIVSNVTPSFNLSPIPKINEQKPLEPVNLKKILVPSI